MIPAITSGTQLQELPARDERIDQAGLQLEQNMQEAQVRLFQVAFDVGFKMGEATQTLRLERLQLESESRKLENEITQLKAVHVAELNGVVDAFLARRQLLVEKVAAVVNELNAFEKTYSDSSFLYSYSPIGTKIGMFETLLGIFQLNPISKANYEKWKEYPEFHDFRSNRNNLLKQTLNVPLVNMLAPVQTQTTIQNLTKKPMDECRVLEAEIAPIRAVNHALTEKKEVMINYHNHHLKELNRQEIEFRYKELLENIRSVYVRMNWEIPAVRYKAIFTPGPWAGGAYVYQQIAVTFPQEGHKKLKEIQEAVKSVISTLETFVNPQPIGGTI